MGMGYGFGAPKRRPIRTEPEDAVARHAPILVMTPTQIIGLPAAGFVPVFDVATSADPLLPTPEGFVSDLSQGANVFVPKRKGGRPKGSKNKPKAK